VNAKLTRDLPTPLAVPYAMYHYGSRKDMALLFGLLEKTLLFVENVLRACASDFTDLSRPASLGFRIARIRKLSQAEGMDHRVGAARAFLNNKTSVQRIIQLRNRWAHADSVGRDVLLRRDKEVEQDLDEILEPVALLRLVLNDSEFEPAKQYVLSGMRGLFEPVELRGAWRLPIDTQLVAVEDELVVPLTPFFTWERGPSGENRVKLLTRVEGRSVHEYLDPLGDSQETSSGKRLPKSSSARRGRSPNDL
jgi:hypothetical protein